MLPGWAKQTTAFMTSQSPGIGNNYRPVSLTSIIGKTFEAIIRDAVVDDEGRCCSSSRRFDY